MNRLLAFLSLAMASCMASSSCTLDPEALPELEHDIPFDQMWPVTPLVPPPAGETRGFVTNNFDDTVTVVNIDALLAGAPSEDVVLGHIPVGFVPVEREGPHHVTTDGEHYYLNISNFVQGSGSGPHGQHGGGTADGHILKLRVSDNSVAGEVRIEPNPGDVRLTPDGSLLLASHFDQLRIIDAAQNGVTEGPELDSKLAIVDPAAMTRIALVPVCPAAHGIGITADSTRAVLSCISDEVAIVNLATQAVTRVPILDEPGTAIAPVCFPYAVTMDGDIAWTSCFNTGELIAVNATTKERDGRSFQLLGQTGMFGDVRDDVMAVAHQLDDGVTFLDVSDPASVSLSSFRLFAADECVRPHAARWSADGARVLVVCEGDQVSPGSLIVIDGAAPHDIIGSALMGLFPDDVAVSP